MGLCLTALIAAIRPNTGLASGYSPVTIAQVTLYQGRGTSPPYGALIQLTTSPSDSEPYSSLGYPLIYAVGVYQ